MRYAYDLHIHSVLSPCADVLMTPNNIFNMASLKKLDIISITDHNSMKQLAICNELSMSYDMLFIPGVEITVKENFDVLCYFKTIEDALKFDKILETYIDKKLFDSIDLRDQEIVDIHDEVKDIYPYLLINPLSLGIKDLIELLKEFNHILVYAHIDRVFRSGIKYLPLYKLDGVEYKKTISSEMEQAFTFYNSDAHQITDILEKNEKNTIELDELTIDGFFRYFNK